MTKLTKEIAPKLTQRERELLHGLKSGETDREIASRLGVSEKTVSNHMRHLSTKFAAKNRTHTLVLAVKMKLIELD
ncbi:MAG: response regulator transcription factor [Sulfuricella sp.]|nr:response regulator transcription factor [Sulfuricella sp.]